MKERDAGSKNYEDGIEKVGEKIRKRKSEEEREKKRRCR